jgi:hypothetical protein
VLISIPSTETFSPAVGSSATTSFGSSDNARGQAADRVVEHRADIAAEFLQLGRGHTDIPAKKARVAMES